MDARENQSRWQQKSRSWLRLSFGLNLALTAVAMMLTIPSPRRPPADPAARAEHVAPVVVTNLPAAVHYVTNRFHWRQLESTNYELYAANLRAAGCPEKTVRDILVADVKKLYNARRRELLVAQPFWTAGRDRRRAERASELAGRALDDEEADVLRRLLGVERHEDTGSEDFRFEEQAIERFILGPMPEETFRRAIAVFDKYERLKNGVDTRANGIRTRQDEGELLGLQRALREELAATLTPLQLEELDARSAAMDLFDNEVLAPVVGLTATEARQLALARANTIEPSREMFGLEDSDELARAARQSAFTNAVHGVLGDARFADFERAQDDEFKKLFLLGKEDAFGKETAVEVYEMRRLAIEESRRLREDTALDAAARDEQLAARQAEIQRAVSHALGAQGYDDYLKKGGAWVTNLTKL